MPPKPEGSKSKDDSNDEHSESEVSPKKGIVQAAREKLKQVAAGLFQDPVTENETTTTDDCTPNEETLKVKGSTPKRKRSKGKLDGRRKSKSPNKKVDDDASLSSDNTAKPSKEKPTKTKAKSKNKATDEDKETCIPNMEGIPSSSSALPELNLSCPANMDDDSNSRSTEKSSLSETAPLRKLLEKEKISKSRSDKSKERAKTRSESREPLLSEDSESGKEESRKNQGCRPKHKKK